MSIQGGLSVCVDIFAGIASVCGSLQSLPKAKAGGVTWVVRSSSRLRRFSLLPIYRERHR
eukprot:4934832-Pleurochrysis_carterae.AAC.4